MPTTVDSIVTSELLLGVPPGVPGATAPRINSDAAGRMQFEDPDAGGPWTLSMLAGLAAAVDLQVFATAAAATAFYGALLNQGFLAFFTNLGAAGQPGYFDGAAWRRMDNNNPVP